MGICHKNIIINQIALNIYLKRFILISTYCCSFFYKFEAGMNSATPTLFAEVILPLAISGSYTYRIPEELKTRIQLGQRVMVQFGKTRVYAAIVIAVHPHPPTLYEAKYLLSIIDHEPIVQTWQFDFWQWTADYYLCTTGDVMNAAMPAALKLSSETKIILNRQVSPEYDELNDKEYLIIEALEIQPELSITEVAAILNQKTVLPYIKSLFDKQLIIVSEEIEERYRPKLESYVRLSAFYEDKAHLKTLFEELNRAPKQQDLVLAYTQLLKNGTEIRKKDLLEKAGVSAAVLIALLEKEVFHITEKEVSRFGKQDVLPVEFSLSEAQQKAYDQLLDCYRQQQTALLHGITSSGKTLLYVKLIEQCLADGKQALYLLPEIALTTQIITRLRKHFGDKIGVYHSKFNDNERAETWKNVLSGTCRVLLGARSAVFLPFKELGLIIIDEEHEQSYKQQDPAPRYHARDTALYLGSYLKIPVILGSATPAIETYYNALQGKYQLVKLNERFGGVNMPQIVTANIREEQKRKTLQGDHFTTTLIDAINATLKKKEQVVLFQNRRGYAPLLSCELCAYTPSCINCDVSLTYHKLSNRLQCHYCGYQQKPLEQCPACGHAHISTKSFGTEKVEDELKTLLPDVSIDRMDLDTTRKKHSTEAIITAFEDKKTAILVGTQMVVKGLDFDNLTLTAILNADNMLNFPDFRAYERSYQLMLQLAGRAGRRDKQGHVIIQTHQPEHPIVQYVINNDYDGFYQTEIQERLQFHYPPFYRLIKITLKHKELNTLNTAAQVLAGSLKTSFGSAVLGPEFPFISRIRNYYHKVIMVKLEKNTALKASKKAITNAILLVQKDKKYKSVIVQPDVDPY